MPCPPIRPAHPSAPRSRSHSILTHLKKSMSTTKLNRAFLMEAAVLVILTWALPLSAQTPQKDTIVVQESQEHALDQVQTMQERAADARAKALLEAVEKEMDKALKHLGAATNSPGALSNALAAEQAAYQALLRLSAHEYQVSRSRNRSKGQNPGQQRNQRQIDELELKQSENKYENQRQAAPQQTPEQREQLQVLSRLKELAQRQQDLNDRLKE